MQWLIDTINIGVSCFVGLAATCLFLPMNHYASKVVVVAQDNLMKARDERVALMNEVLGAIRMLKVGPTRPFHEAWYSYINSLWLGRGASKQEF